MGDFEGGQAGPGDGDPRVPRDPQWGRRGVPVAGEGGSDRTLLQTLALWPEFDDPSFDAWRVLAKVIDGAPLDPAQLATYQTCSERQTYDPGQPPREVYLVVGRRGGKSLFASAVAVWIATATRKWRLAPGEVSIVPIIAADREQAQVMLRYCKGLLLGAADLRRRLVGEPTRTGIRLRNRTVIEIHTANFRTIRGRTVAGAFADELAFWRAEDGSANLDRDIIDALKPSLLTTRGPLICISSPYARRGVLWDQYKRHFGRDGDPVLVWQASSLEMNPKLPEEEIARAYEEDPQKAAAEYGGEFRTDLEAFISEEVLDRVTVPGRLELPRSGRHYGFVDMSGGSGDSAVLAIGHRDRERGLGVLDKVVERTSPHDPFNVTAEFSDVCDQYGIKEIVGDHYAGTYPKAAFDKFGIAYKVSEKTKSEIYLEVLPLLTGGKVELLESMKLRKQFLGLERRTGRSGKDSVDHGPRKGDRDDVCNAVAGVLCMIADSSQHFDSHVWGRPVFGRSRGSDGPVVDQWGTRFEGDGRYVTRDGEVYRDPRCS